MFTRTVALEQSFSDYPAKIISFAPGIVETAMQSEIRSSDKKDFRDHEKFVKLYEEGKLSTPGFVAGHIVNALFDDSVVQGSVMDIWHLKE